jgi:hypothetical protein
MGRDCGQSLAVSSLRYQTLFKNKNGEFIMHDGGLLCAPFYRDGMDLSKANRRHTWSVSDNAHTSVGNFAAQLNLNVSRFEIPIDNLTIDRPSKSLDLSWCGGNFWTHELTDSSELSLYTCNSEEQPVFLEKKLGLVLSFYRTDCLLVAIYDHIGSYTLWLDILNSYRSYILQGFTKSASLYLR